MAGPAPVGRPTPPLPPDIPASPGEDPLRAAAREFEAILLETVLRQMRETAEALGGEDRGVVHGVYASWMDRELARALAAGKGLGLGEVLYRSLAGAARPAAPGAAHPDGAAGAAHPDGAAAPPEDREEGSSPP
ncbi:rod-binding protein [Caldinitratiruptor microaerophilus]|uniref:Flagellar protein FlgJ N-terminal domain-containing protein n=1 Tax=Caldinitratiruptor microaerophilus TaxID=671077 RepID=A0AA35CPV1_9FIRM|nr:rod-binding protein [Caldinitratiruptor microaerophilus]BDG61751.1 hypothetical protein caldi_28410 [Caldinitratiruptor microaerophilus]